MKPTAFDYAVLRNSALSHNTEINTLMLDLVRIMHNVSLLFKTYETRKHLQNFLRRLQCFGYDKKDRIRVYREARKKLVYVKEGSGTA